ncbi:MAG: hypothetical protein MHM6MM_001654 [Cercozoa sp. M6MM]
MSQSHDSCAADPLFLADDGHDSQPEDSFVALQLPNSLTAHRWLRRSELLNEAKLGRTVFGAQYQCDRTMTTMRLERDVPMELIQVFLSEAIKAQMFDPESDKKVFLFVPASVANRRGGPTLYQDLCFLCGAAPFADRVCITLDGIGRTQPNMDSVHAAIGALLAADVVRELHNNTSKAARCSSLRKQLPSVCVHCDKFTKFCDFVNFKHSYALEKIQTELFHCLQERYCLTPAKVKFERAKNSGPNTLKLQVFFPPHKKNR